MDANVKQEKKQDQWLKGWCAMCLQNDCGMLVRTRDGVVMEIKGDPDCPTNRGKLCVRGGLAAIPGYYSPHRIKNPLKRTNPKKGLDEDPRWVEISWDEALNLVAERLRKIRKEDPAQIRLHGRMGNLRRPVRTGGLPEAAGRVQQVREHVLHCRRDAKSC